MVESSYPDEVFNLAIDTTAGTSFEINMKSLKQLCSNLNIFDIRNAIATQTTVSRYIWFRAAAIASDPLIFN